MIRVILLPDKLFNRENLSDWELISVVSYLKRLLRKKDPQHISDFKDLRDAHFGGDDEKLEVALRNFIKYYTDDYTSRHKN